MRVPDRALATCLASLLAAAATPASTFTVTTTADSGAGSLRQAIADANGNAGADTIAFNIPGAGVHTIAPATALPALGASLTIDGSTQPGSSPNTNAADQGLNTVLQIEIDCTSAGTYCLQVGGDDVTIRGLAMNRAPAGYLIATDFFKRVQNTIIEGCFLGTTPDGMTALPLATGVILGNHQNARVGGTSPAQRNLFASTGAGKQLEISNASNNGSAIQGNLFCTNRTGLAPIGSEAIRDGIQLSGGGGAGNTSNVTIGGLTPEAGNVFACPYNNLRLTNMSTVAVQGNRIGVDPSGTKAISGGKGTGIYLEGAQGSSISIGGSAAGAGNVMGGLLTALASFGGTGATVQGNFIGTDASQTRDLGNTQEGLILTPGVSLVVGGTSSGEGNAILFNRGGGIRVTCCSAGNTIRGNRIFGNLGSNSSNVPSIGIDLTAPAGPNASDAGDADTGGNDLQNPPLVTSAAPEGGGTRIVGSLDSAASSPFTLDFYANPVCRARPRAQLQADQYLGSANVSTNASGVASFNVLLPIPIAAGQPVTATATTSNGSTSELSPEIVFSSTPDFGEAAGGQPLQIRGMLFAGTPTVTIGGVPATDVTLLSATQINATAPARPAGTVNDIVVTVAGGLTGRLRNGYVSLFSDVPGGYTYAQAIARLVGSGITLGCGGGIYCPDNSITRAEMAIFLVRAKFGLCFTPPPATGTMFSDVPAGAFGARQIELIASLGVTSGCGGGKFCPNSTVTRDQMAVFLLRTLLGSSFVPPAATGMFGDVPVSNPFAKWIEELARRNITGGCGGGNYCPANPNTRGEMAAFITRTFGLP